MQTRLSPHEVWPKGYQAMVELEKYVRSCGLETSLLHMIKLRASQINGCAFCIDMHWKDARAEGETEQRLYGLSAWREAPYYTDRERAALEWTEALTLVAETHVPDDIYEKVVAQFNGEDMVNLSLAITTINAWNRLAIAFRYPAGSYVVGNRPSAQ